MTARQSAGCRVSSDAGAVARPIDMAKDPNLLGAKALLAKMDLMRYRTIAARKPSWDRGRFAAGRAPYKPTGDDITGRHRLAKPSHKGDPIAGIMAVTEITKLNAASKQGMLAPADG